MFGPVEGDGMSVYRTPAQRDAVPVGLECPWCREQAMGRWRKYVAHVKTPFVACSCERCGRRVTARTQPLRNLRRNAMLGIPPMLALNLLAPRWLFAVAAVSMLVAQIVLHNREVLVGDE